MKSTIALKVMAGLSLTLLLAAAPLAAQDCTTVSPGCLDTTFNGTGKVMTNTTQTSPITNGGQVADGVAVDSYGRIVVGGWSPDNTLSKYDFTAVRYNPDGSLDTTFGNGGIAKASLTSGSDVGYALALQNETTHTSCLSTDQRILVAGQADSGTEFGIARFCPDGSLDTAFGAKGVTVISFGKRASPSANAIVIQSNGEIVLAGVANSNFALVRLTADGTLDSTFGGSGKVTFAFGKSSSRAAAVLVESNGDIVAGGYASPKGYDEFALVGFLPSGAVNTAFGSKGSVLTDFSGSKSFIQGMALASSGNIVAVGYAASTGGLGLARYTPSGQLDPTFGSSGKVALSFGADAAVAIQSDASIVTAGGQGVSGQFVSSFALARFNSNGSLDTSFGAAGTGEVTTAFSGVPYSSAAAVALDASTPVPTILAAGWSQATQSGGFAYSVARYFQ